MRSQDTSQHAENQSTATRPAWTKSAVRLDRPRPDTWYKPEAHGALDGLLLWQGSQEDFHSGEEFHMYLVKDDKTSVVFGVREKAGLRALRSVKPGSRVFINPKGKKDIGNGRSMWDFELLAQDVDVDDAGAGGGSDTEGGAAPF